MAKVPNEEAKTIDDAGADANRNMIILTILNYDGGADGSMNILTILNLQ